MKCGKLLALFAAVLFAAFAVAAPVSGRMPVQHRELHHELNPMLLGLPRGRWVKIHQQLPGDAVIFSRQRHGGSAFDTHRGRLVLFGSDTHDSPDASWSNEPLIFDLGRLVWLRPYPADPVSSYRVDAEGLPVAGRFGDHPWAMHTFGAVTYDPVADAIVVSSYPAHLEPGRFTDALASVWQRVAHHPTWLWQPDTGRWRALSGDNIHFFAWPTAYDSFRKLIVGYRYDGIYTLRTKTGKWRRIADGGLLGWGSNAVFDSTNRVLIVYGSHQKRNDIVVFEPSTRLQRKMPTPGKRPSGGNYVPLAFHPGTKSTIALIDQPAQPDKPFGTTETWLYNYRQDVWTHLEKADLPFGIGMNYNLEYDPGHELLLLCATPPDETLPAVWALDPGRLP